MIAIPSLTAPTISPGEAAAIAPPTTKGASANTFHSSAVKLIFAVIRRHLSPAPSISQKHYQSRRGVPLWSPYPLVTILEGCELATHSAYLSRAGTRHSPYVIGYQAFDWLGDPSQYMLLSLKFCTSVLSYYTHMHTIG